MISEVPYFRGAPSDEDEPGERFFSQIEEERIIPLRTKATVAIARTVERYRDHKTIYALTKEANDYLGGIQTFVKPG